MCLSDSWLWVKWFQRHILTVEICCLQIKKKKKKRKGRRSSQNNWLDYKGIKKLRIKITQKFWDLENEMLCQESIDVIIKT